MARRDTSARRYAEAAFEIGRADDTLDGWERDMATIGSTMQHPELRALLQHPAVPFADKERVLRKVMGRGVASAPLNLILLMVRRGRPGAIDRMIEQARAAGANAIVNIRFSTSNIAAGAAEVMAYGTAVVVS